MNRRTDEGVHNTPSLIMQLTSQKLEGHIASGTFVRSSVHPFFRSSRFLMHSVTLDACMHGTVLIFLI